MKRTAIFLAVLSGAAILFFSLQDPEKKSSPWEKKESKKENAEKINGVSFVAPVQPIASQQMVAIREVNANWVAVTPYAFSRSGRPEVTFDYQRQWWGERPEGIIKTVEYAKELGMKVMIKPHVWVREEGWAGDFELSSEKDWHHWERDYSAYILQFAEIADSLNAEMMCIGTEFRKAARQRPQFWRTLIANVRAVYGGKVTYASNWDNYQNIRFWDDLDYIGIDAYFPISSERSPEVDQLINGWKELEKELEKFSDDHSIPILFTEFGYQSTDYAAGGDWNYDVNKLEVNHQAQANAYEALFKVFWAEPWFAGGFLWKWHADPERSGRNGVKRFTPQNKPAEEVIRTWYGRVL